VEETHFSSWLDEFESQVQEKLEHMGREVCMPTTPSLRCSSYHFPSPCRSQLFKAGWMNYARNEKRSIQEAENFRQTLEATVSILATAVRFNCE